MANKGLKEENTMLEFELGDAFLAAASTILGDVL